MPDSKTLCAPAARAPGGARARAGSGPPARRRRHRLAARARRSRAHAAAAQIRSRRRCSERRRRSAGIAGAPRARFKRLFMSPGPIFEARGSRRRSVGRARPRFAAAGFRRGDVVLNCFSYHLTPGGFIMESGAHALGCASSPPAPAIPSRRLQAIAHLQPNGYRRAAGFPQDPARQGRGRRRRRVLAAQGAGLRRGAAADAARRAGGARRRARGRPSRPPNSASIAYETDGPDGALAPGLKVNEDLIVEIVHAGQRRSAAAGAVGEIVVTRAARRLPAAALRHRRSLRLSRRRRGIRGWMGRADQTTKVKGMFVHPSEVVEIGKRHPRTRRAAARRAREGEQDAMTLLAETAAPATALAERSPRRCRR